VAPSFIAKDKMVFMSRESMILCYQVFDDNEVSALASSKPLSKQLFNVAQCQQTCSSSSSVNPSDIVLDQMFFSGDHLIGENILLV
jgi:hypothetical protein